MSGNKNESGSPTMEAAVDTPEQEKENDQVEMQENMTERSYYSNSSADIVKPVA